MVNDVHIGGISIPSLFDSSVDNFYPYVNSSDLEFNILDADTLEFTLPVNASSDGPMGGNFYNDTPLSFEVELDPNNPNYHSILDKITITDNIFEFQEGELYSINDNSDATITFQIDNLF